MSQRLLLFAVMQLLMVSKTDRVFANHVKKLAEDKYCRNVSDPNNINPTDVYRRFREESRFGPGVDLWIRNPDGTYSVSWEAVEKRYPEWLQEAKQIGLIRLPVIISNGLIEIPAPTIRA